MICPSCRAGADALTSVGTRGFVSASRRLHSILLHDACIGASSCPCQHRVDNVPLGRQETAKVGV